MPSKQSTIAEILDSEREMVIGAGERYGPYYEHALQFTALLGNGMIKSIHPDRFIFAAFLAHIKKHLTLALFSTVRLHHVQGMMNVRQALEAGACAAYAIANTDPADFADTKDDGTVDPTQKLAKKRYDWLGQHFSVGSESLKRIKDALNHIDTHANIVTAHHTFKVDYEQGRFDTNFFDHENTDLVKTDLWLIGNVTLGLMDLFFGVNKDLGVIRLEEEWNIKFKQLASENTQLKADMIKNKSP